MVANKLNEQKRQHRERAQPLGRQKLGLLEKHADYVKRARDFHSKEDRITKLREKAAGKNKDEFYFGMIRSKTVKGVHVQSRGNVAMPDDLVQVLKTQDAGYIRTHKAMEESRVKRLQQQLDSLVDQALGPQPTTGGDGDEEMDDWDAFDEVPVASTSAAPQRKHIIFTTNLETVRSADPASLLSRRKPPPLPTATKKSKKGKGKLLPDVDVAAQAAEEAQRVAEATAHRESLTKELDARQARLTSLSRALKELETQRLLMGKGAKKAIIPTIKKNSGAEQDWSLGYKGQQMDQEGRGGLPDAEEGVATGARVWKWKVERKR